MTDATRDDLDLRDEDRLPWLEPVEDVDAEGGVSPVKLAGIVLGVLAVLGLVVAAVWWLRERQQAPQGDGSLIAAPPGDYKMKADEPGGMKVEGTGDASFAASEGAEARGRIDTGAIPEAPVAADKAPVRTAQVVATGSAKVADGGKLAAKVPAARPAPRSAEVAAGQVIQLGAYNSEAIASAAWARMEKRFAFLSGKSKIVVPVQVGGNTLYRLRTDAGSSEAAKDLCGRLAVAGESCLIARN